jgi:hypothetical protein
MIELIYYFSKFGKLLVLNAMKSITINFNNDRLAEKVIGLLELLKKEGLEIVLREDFEDLKLLKATRNEESVPFEEYLRDENKYS